jgi:hypothetical protein
MRGWAAGTGLFVVRHWRRSEADRWLYAVGAHLVGLQILLR